MNDRADDERKALRHYLQYQRDSVFSVVDGLDEKAWHTSVVPSGWTVAGFVEHLGSMERHWFQHVLAGSENPLPWGEGRPPYDPAAAFTCDRPSADILAYYRDQCRRSDEVLARMALSAPPRGRHGDPGNEPPSVRWVVLHVIEETAAHSGHLEIARELLDGHTDLGLR